MKSTLFVQYKEQCVSVNVKYRDSSGNPIFNVSDLLNYCCSSVTRERLCLPKVLGQINLHLPSVVQADHTSLPGEVLRPGKLLQDLVREKKGTSDDQPLIISCQNDGLSASVSTISIVSCKSKSSSGRCITGRHVARNKNDQSRFRKALIARDEKCILTGETDEKQLCAAHIFPLDRSFLIERDLYFSPKNGILLRKDLEDDYDRHMWYFDENGQVHVLFKQWKLRNLVNTVNLAQLSTNAPDITLIKRHNQLAEMFAQHHCPHCWKLVGKVNLKNHQLKSCEKLNIEADEVEDLTLGEDFTLENDW